MENVLKGLAKAIIRDGVVENDEIILLHQWLTSIDMPDTGPVRELRDLIDRICCDGVVTSRERIELLDFLKSCTRHIAPKEKGYDFEKCVLKHFDRRSYRLHEWRSDKYLRNWGGPPSNSAPDLELEHITSGRRFAIECKYRTGLSDGKFVWATPRKYENYVRYQQRNHIQVFVAFGLGGTPIQPLLFAVMPLADIRYTGLFPSILERYKQTGDWLSLDELENPTRGSCLSLESQVLMEGTDRQMVTDE